MGERRWGSVVLGAVGVGVLANAYRPLARKGYASLLAWGAGLVVSELPLQTIAVGSGAVALAIRRAPRRVRIWAALLSVPLWAGFLGLDRIARRAATPLDAALDEALGPGSRSADAPKAATTPCEGVAKPRGLIRTMHSPREFAHHANVPYGECGAANLLDIWRRPDLPRQGRAPVLLQVPGGAWAVGNKRGQAYPLLSHLVERGWVCVSINHRQGPRHSWPDHIVDVKKAIAWVKATIENYGGDPDFVTLSGGSSGGHLAAIAALTANDPRFQPGFADAETSVRAAVPIYGVYDLTRTDDALHPMMVPHLEKLVFGHSRADSPDAFAAASPITYARPDAPPFFIVHGRNDSFIPVAQARAFAARLREVSAQPVAYAELAAAQHAFDLLGTPRAAHTAAAVGRFLAVVHSAWAAEPARNLREVAE